MREINFLRFGLHEEAAHRSNFALGDQDDQLDKHDCVNIFISEGAGVKDIVAKMEAEGKNVPRDAFGHVKLDAINPGKARPPSPRQRAQAVRT